MSLRAMLSICAVTLLCTLNHRAAHAAPQAPVVHNVGVVLENGARVILIPVPGATRVGVQVVHRVGSIHEPAGMPQLAHLVEHLVCFGATGGHAEREAFDTGMARGSTNAETLGDVTRYEHEAPAADLERILTLEADRLRVGVGGVVFTPALLAQESPRIDQEAGFVEGSPMAPLLKYAFIAAPQAWFHERNEAPLAGATKDFDLAAVGEWRQRWYRTDRVTIAIVGGFEPDAAAALVRATIGAVPRPADPGPPAPAWSKAPRASQVKWTSKHSALVIAFEPPDDPVQRLALTLLGDLTLERLYRDEQVKRVALLALCSNRTWPVGDLPLFVYATVKPGVEPAEARRVLDERFGTILREVATPAALAMAALSLAPQPAPTWEQAQAQGKQAFGNRPGFTGDAGGMVLLFYALQAALRDRVAGDAAVLESVKAMTAERIKAIVERATAPENEWVTMFTP